MRLPGDTACFVELVAVSVLPTGSDRDQRPFVRGAEATATCASLAPNGVWSVRVTGGTSERALVSGDRVVVTGTHRVTGDRFSVPVALECTATQGTLRFSVPQPRVLSARWAMAG